MADSNAVYLIFKAICKKYFGNVNLRTSTAKSGIRTITMRSSRQYFIGRRKKDGYDTGNTEYYAYGYIKYVESVAGCYDEYDVIAYGFMLKSKESNEIYKDSDVETVLTYDNTLKVRQSDIQKLNNIWGAEFSTKDFDRRAVYYTPLYFDLSRLDNRNPVYELMLAAQHFLDTADQCVSISHSNADDITNYMMYKPVLYGSGLLEGSKRTLAYKLAEVMESRVIDISIMRQYYSKLPFDDFYFSIELSNKNFSFRSWDLVSNPLTLIVGIKQKSVSDTVEIMMRIEPAAHNGIDDLERQLSTQLIGVKIEEEHLTVGKLKRLAYKLFNTVGINIYHKN